MKKTMFIGLALGTAVIGSATLDLNNLANYERQTIPNYILKDNTPANNMLWDEFMMACPSRFALRVGC
jgi:hypothetical protein